MKDRCETLLRQAQLALERGELEEGYQLAMEAEGLAAEHGEQDRAEPGQRAGQEQAARQQALQMTDHHIPVIDISSLFAGPSKGRNEADRRIMAVTEGPPVASHARRDDISPAISAVPSSTQVGW